MSDEDGEPIEEAPESPPKAEPAVRKDRRADDQPEWFRRWRAEEDAKVKPSDDSEDDGILSIEELPDLEEIEDAVEDVVDKGKEFVESIPERTHWLFGKVFGKKE